jgi:hypothetical protein
MFAMATNRDKRQNFRTLPRFKAVLNRLVGNIRATERFARRDKHLTQEAIMNASWLWMAEMDPETLAVALEPFIARWETEWEAADCAPPAPGAKVGKGHILDEPGAEKGAG